MTVRVSKYTAGFTLIELLIVIAIIGLLATLATYAVTDAAKKSRDTVRHRELQSMQKALSLYYDDNGSYPNTGGNWWGHTIYGNHPLTGPTGYIPNLAPTYIGELPEDPHPTPHTELYSGCDTAAKADYLYRSDGLGYKILSYCAIETGRPSADDPMRDPNRPSYAIMVCEGTAAACAW